jgi:hypothetical protein
VDWKKSLKKAKSFGDIFCLVKKAVRNYLGADQAGILVGLSDLGFDEYSCLGAFYSLDANTIIINKGPLNSIKHTNPSLYNPYLFYILLHEYIHSLGILEEEHVRLLAYQISQKNFGECHLTTQMASDLERFIPNLTFTEDFEPPEDINIEFLPGVDRDNTDYIM